MKQASSDRLTDKHLHDHHREPLSCTMGGGAKKHRHNSQSEKKMDILIGFYAAAPAAPGLDLLR